MDDTSSVKGKIKADWIEWVNRRRGVHRIYGFLDFDGVINLYNFDVTDDEVVKEKARNNEFYDLDCVANLNRLCLAYDIHIVISSSWRYSGIDYCSDYLHKAGLDEKIDICGMTDTDWVTHRPQHIVNYLLAHPDYSGWVVFDDLDMPQLGRHLMRCDSRRGLDQAKREEAEAYLSRIEKHPASGIE
jgi:hypothetical protein